MSGVAISSLFGGILCLGLSIAPIPYQRYAMLRCGAAVGAIGCFSLGHSEAGRQKKMQAEFDRLTKLEEEQQQAIDEMEWRNLEAIEQGKREALVIEARRKEEARIEVSLADYTDDVQDAYVLVQDGKGRLDRVLARLQPPELDPEPEPDPEPEQIALPEPETEEQIETLAIKKAKLLKLINEHEGGWIGQAMQKPLLIYGDMGSYKSYLASFLALCRHYLRGHQIISIADPHFHQNCEESWKCLVAIGVPGYGANQNYQAVGQQLNAMYDRFATRTLKDKPYTSIWDEVTGYSSEEGTIEPAKKLIRKVVGDPRKANEAPILIGHDNTLAALGGGEGFSKSRDRGIIQIELYSDSENRPLFKGTLSGIKNNDGEFVDAQKVSIAPDWIRPEWVFELFNTKDETLEIPTETKPEIEPKKLEPTTTSNKAEFLDQARKWLDDIYKPEAEVTSDTTPWDEVDEVRSEVPEVRNINASGCTSPLPEDVRSKALTRILTLLAEVGSTSNEVIELMPINPDKAVWIGIKLLGKSMTAASRDIFCMGVGGAKFKTAKGWYEALRKEFGK
jgi:hypothetical protein